MPELADILRACGTVYRENYAQRMLPSHKRAMQDVTCCRTEVLGGQVYLCKKCEDYRFSYHSCKNRHCPKCGNDAATRWLAAQGALLLPVKHFLVTVTLPQGLRPLARKNQKLIYGLLLRCGAQAMQKLARDPKFVGGEVGIIGVLQTWRRDMHYHPHVHFIVTGGGVSSDDQRWLPVQRDYLMPNKALAKIFRAKFRDALKKTAPELFCQVHKMVWRTDWVIDIRPVGAGQTALKYLAPYIFRVAISNNRIVKFANGQVTFRYKDTTGRWHNQTLTAEAFISRFLQHVLPKRFVKVRYYGFFSPRKRQVLQCVKELFAMASIEDATKSGIGANEVRTVRCPRCGEVMLFVREIRPQACRPP